MKFTIPVFVLLLWLACVTPAAADYFQGPISADGRLITNGELEDLTIDAFDGELFYGYVGSALFVGHKPEAMRLANFFGLSLESLAVNDDVLMLSDGGVVHRLDLQTGEVTVPNVPHVSSVEAAGEMFFAIAPEGIILASEDGKRWAEAAHFYPGARVHKTTYGDGKYLILWGGKVQGMDRREMLISEDGKNFRRVGGFPPNPSYNNERFSDPMFADGQFAVFFEHYNLASKDGENWSVNMRPPMFPVLVSFRGLNCTTFSRIKVHHPGWC